MRFVELAHVQMSLAGRQQEVALLGTVPSLAFHQTLGPAQPSAGLAGFSAREQAKPQPERGSGRGQALSRLEVRVVQALLGRQHLLVPRRQPRGRGQALEIVGPERGGRIRQRQRVEGVVPLVALETGPPPFQELRRLGGAVLGTHLGGAGHWMYGGGACLSGGRKSGAGFPIGPRLLMY